jgi:hypothetical protein
MTPRFGGASSLEKNMEFIEYPKALYRGDVMRIAQDTDEEAALRADGFGGWQAEKRPSTPPRPIPPIPSRSTATP